VTLEAMAHRRPVVATTAGGLPDKVHQGITGWLVEPGDAEQLALALNDAMSRREHLMALGAAGRALVEREFSWDAVAQRTIALYRDLTAGGRSSGALHGRISRRG
jgi:glycogen synthase